MAVLYLLWGSETTIYVTKAVGTIGVGIIGGIAGMLGKDMYAFMKPRLVVLWRHIYHRAKQKFLK